ncbi:MAG: PhzF family phenazine biosynthesis protein [Anaerolineales bacterium]|nr:PhzF family phenazine biosynthesis protein [Anaerolineales bacterium]
MSQSIVQVDAFTDTPFAGNPAAVCLLTAPRDAEWMQHVAREMNLSETAFLYPEDDGFRLRWFTPIVEVPLCGHATLASAHVLYETKALDAAVTARFFTLSGELRATKNGDWITLDFPSRPVTPRRSPFDIAAALGAPVLNIAGNDHQRWLAEVESEEVLRALTPNFAAMMGVYGVIATCRATTPGFDFMSRFFAPSIGINEDPVTGGAHCSLTPYWAEALGKTEMVGYQASARVGVVRVRLADERVYLSGQALTVLRGELTL